MAGADRMTIEEVVRKVLLDEHADVIREAVKAVAAEMMELEVSELIGAAARRAPARGSRDASQRLSAAALGHARRRVGVADPQARQGSYFPSFLEPRKRSEQALLAVVQQAYVLGVSTRRVDQLVERLGLRISKSDVSRVCEQLDEHVEAFRTRPLEGRYPYLFLDAKMEKVRDGGRVVAKALVVAHGVHETGRREILSIDVGEAETEAFWTDFLRGLVSRGLVGVAARDLRRPRRLEGGDREGPRLRWQRCTVHFLRDCLGHARKDQHGLLAALIRPIFNAETLDQARDRLSEAVAHLDGRMGKVATLLEDAETDILAFYAFPAGALAEVALDQSARALQQGDRPPHRRRRHLPQRPGPDPARRDALHRTERRVAGRPQPTSAPRASARCSAPANRTLSTTRPRNDATSIRRKRRWPNSSRPEPPTTSPTR